MSGELQWTGLRELEDDLRRLPDDLTGEASHIIEAAANGAAAEIKPRYGVKTGNLRDHLEVRETHDGPFSAGYVVINTAKHAGLYESGTQARHTDIGANRGRMPAAHVFIPVAIRKRRQMYEQLKAMVERHGLEVSGDA
jgi:hypothetical protein